MDPWQILRGRWSIRQRAYANMLDSEVERFRAGMGETILATSRMDVVRHYIDTADRRALERLCETAADEFGVPNAQVNVITADEQITLAHVGMPGTCPREDGWCHNVVALGEAIAISDSAHHRMVSDHQKAGEIISYMGAPIVAEGQTIGVFCIFADSARVWTEAECVRLRELARLASEARH